MKFCLEIGPQSTLENLPPVKDVYITMLPGGDYKETAAKSGELVEKGFNPVPHFPARSINDDNELKDYVTRCKDLGVKQALVIGGGREPIGKFDSSYQMLETGFFDGIKIGIAGHPEGSHDISDTNLEKAIYNYALKEAELKKIVKKWENPLFLQLYTDRLFSIYMNMKNEKILQSLKSKELLPVTFAFMTHQEMNPEHWKELLEKKRLIDKSNKHKRFN